MSEGSSSASSGYRPWWLENKEKLRSAFPFLHKLSAVKDINDGKLLPKWTAADVEEFAKVDPVHGPEVIKARNVATAAAVGAGVGGLGFAAYCLRYSSSPAGALLVLVVGSAASWALTEEVGSAVYGLNTVSPTDANVKFLEWWQQKQQS